MSVPVCQCGVGEYYLVSTQLSRGAAPSIDGQIDQTSIRLRKKLGLVIPWEETEIDFRAALSGSHIHIITFEEI